MTDHGLKIKYLCATFDCRDALALGKFYAALLKWEIGSPNEDWAWVYAPGTEQGTYPYLLFQRNPAYIPPVWPERPGSQQQMAHIDIAVNDLEKAVSHAIDCGATLADEQFDNSWRVMFDPEGHPFCLCLNEAIFAANE